MLRSGSKSRSGRGGAKEGVGKSVWEGWWGGGAAVECEEGREQAAKEP